MREGSLLHLSFPATVILPLTKYSLFLSLSHYSSFSLFLVTSKQILVDEKPQYVSLFQKNVYFLNSFQQTLICIFFYLLKIRKKGLNLIHLQNYRGQNIRCIFLSLPLSLSLSLSLLFSLSLSISQSLRSEVLESNKPLPTISLSLPYKVFPIITHPPNFSFPSTPNTSSTSLSPSLSSASYPINLV